MNRFQFIASLLALTALAGHSFGAQVAELEVGRVRAAVVYPEHYAKDPGAGFPLVLLSDASQAPADAAEDQASPEDAAAAAPLLACFRPATPYVLAP